MHFFISRFVCFCFSLPLFSFSQHLPTLAQQADSLYQIEDFEQAFIAYDRLIKLDSSRAEAFHRRGACFLNEGKLEAAKRDFRKALKRDAKYANSYYNLGLIANQQGEHHEGLRYFRAFMLLAPDDPEGMMNLAANFVYLNQADSFDLYFQRAFALDSQDIRMYQIGATDYAYFERYTQAEKYIEKALKHFPTESAFYDLALDIYDQQDKHSAALRTAERAKQQFPGEMNWYHEVALKRIVANTAKEVIYKEPNSQDKFSHISARQSQQLRAWFKNKSGKYHVQHLLKKYEEMPGQLGFDEYFMLYAGQKKGKSTARYEIAMYRDMIASGLVDSALHIIQLALAEKPTQVDLHYLAASCHAKRGDWERFELSIQHYYGFLLGIIYTGTGLSFEKAFLITQPQDAYFVMELLDLPIAKMEEVEFEKKSYQIAYSGGQSDSKICFYILE